MNQSHRRTDLKSEITSILHSAPIVDNLARKTFISLFVISLIQLRKVQFNELATVFNEQAKIVSNQNRIEDFFREVEINFQAVAQLMLVLLPKKGKLRLTIDRTDLNASPVAFWQMPSKYFDGFDRVWRFTTAALLGDARQQKR